MKKALYLFAAALAIFASCDPKEDVKPEEPKLNVAEKSVVLDSAGDSKTIAVEANNAWTAEVTSGQDWLRAEAKADELVISAPAWTTHQPRMGAVTVKSKDLNVVVAVTQLAAPNNDKISVTPTSVNFDAAGESKTVTVTANVEVKAVASESWVTITPPATQSGSMTFTLAAAANTASTARNASVTFSGGEADDVTIQVSQNPADVIEVDNNDISATAEGGDFIVKVTANVEWTATASDSWITVSPEKGQSGDLKISVAANENTAERTATVAIAKGSTGVVINVKQAGKPGEETLLATWRCDNAEYVESHSPDWSTDGANATSHGTGKGIALPEDGERRLGDSLGLDAYGDGDLLPDFTAKQIIHDRETYIRECGESFFDGVRADHTRRPEATVDDAILIAADVFSDEVDPADGRPAILSHLSQLYKRGMDVCDSTDRSPYRYETNRYTICAILRDVIGKKGWTAAKLRSCGFPERVVTPLSILSRREGERTRAYITRIGLSGCKCAIRIKSDELEDRKRIDPERKEYYHEQLVCLHKAARDDYEF